MEVLRHFEFGISTAALLLLVVYYVHLYHKTRNDPLSTALGLARRTRALWVQTIMKNGKDILAVQTLRNWTMAATFLGNKRAVETLSRSLIRRVADQTEGRNSARRSPSARISPVSPGTSCASSSASWASTRAIRMPWAIGA